MLCFGLLVSLISLLLPKHDVKGSEHISEVSQRITSQTRILAVPLLVLLAFLMTWAVSNNALDAVSQIAVVLTLVALIAYAYDTHRIAKWTTTPSASFFLTQADQQRNPLILTSLPRNYSKVPLVCHCNLHAKLCGESVEYGGFYSGKKPWYLQPLQRPQGIVDLRRIFEAGGYIEAQIRERWEQALSETQSSVLRLDVEFWYSTLDGRFNSPHFREGYYFNFSKNALVLDPHIGPAHQDQ